MLDNETRPFLAGQRHDSLRALLAGRNETVQRQVLARVGRSLSPNDTKIDGKAGAVDGLAAVIRTGAVAGFGPQPPLVPKLPNEKDSKETKEAKETKDIKETKDSKDNKEGKETKEIKETKETKEGKETSKESKETKEAKEIKEIKETKEAKETKESKETSKEGKEIKEGKETKEGKEIKDTKEVKETKELIIEAPEPFSPTLPKSSIWRKGDPADLPWSTFNAIAEAHPSLVETAIDRGNVVL